MQSTEIDKIIQVITDQVIKKLEAVTEDKILCRGENKTYPAQYLQKLSADYHLEFGTKQDSDAILLCLREATLTQLLAISNLNVVNSLTKQVISFLLAGKPIWIFDDAPKLSKYRHTTRFEVWRLLQRALERLNKFDIQFINSDEQLKEALVKLEKLTRPTQVKKKFITESVLRERLLNNENLVNSGELLTSLASDWFKQHQINMENR